MSANHPSDGTRPTPEAQSASNYLRLASSRSYLQFVLKLNHEVETDGGGKRNRRLVCVFTREKKLLFNKGNLLSNRPGDMEKTKTKKTSTSLFRVNIGCVIKQRTSVDTCKLLPHKYIIKFNIYGVGDAPALGGGRSSTFATRFHTLLAQVVAIAIGT